MLDTVTRYLSGVTERKWAHALRIILHSMADRFSSQALSSAGLVITAGGSTTAKNGNAVNLVAGGKPVTIAANTNMPALTGINLASGQYGIVCFFVDAAGTLTALAGPPGASAGAAGFPQFPRGQALVGYILINATSAFTGGTTALDAVTTQYNSPVGAFDPTIVP